MLPVIRGRALRYPALGQAGVLRTRRAVGTSCSMSNDVRKTLEKSAKNVRDSIDETMHRSAADAEKARREGEGDSMTAGDRVVSAVDEAKHRTQAGIDHAKREARGDR